MEQTKLGELIDASAGRDAIHVALAPVVAGHILTPGEHVGWMDETMTTVGRVPKTIGIVDPFLRADVMPHQRFFVVLYQQSITGLRHVWTHPDFPDTDVAPATTKPHAMHKVESAEWIKALAARIGITVIGLMDAAQTWLESEDHTIQQGSDSWRDDFGDPVEFWHHYEIVTGTIVPADKKRSFFCCTC
jgi:hypothetical protein